MPIPACPPGAVALLCKYVDADGHPLASWCEPIAPPPAVAPESVLLGAVARLPRGDNPTAYRARVDARADLSATLAGDEDAAQRTLDLFLKGEALAAEFETRTACDLLRDPEINIEVKLLKDIGVNNAAELVLRRGVIRCRQCRIWVQKNADNPHRPIPRERWAHVVSSMILNGVPEHVRAGGRRRGRTRGD